MFRKSSDGTQYRWSFLVVIAAFCGGKDENMSGANGRRARHFFGGAGLYIALFLCAAGLAVAGYWSLIPKDTPPEKEVSSPVEVELPAPVMPEVRAPESVVPAPVEKLPVFDPEPVEAAPVAPRLIVDPLKGETIAAFSVDALAYNETLGDWRTHDGIDIAAGLGTQVLAACSGTVTAISDDDMMGTSVTIAHDGGYETIYANLQSVPTVAVGEAVTAGQVIGSVGDTALSESSSRPHLHFAVRKDDQAYDPREFLNS